MKDAAKPAETILRECDDFHFPTAQEIRLACSSLPGGIPGTNVLDVCPSNASFYLYGSYQLVQRDLELVLPETLARHVDKFLHSLGVPNAFFARKELVNYKKVMLYVHEQGISLERNLAQLNTILNYEPPEERASLHRNEDYWAPTMWSGELLDAHMQCKGRCTATLDIRRFTKEICCLPRHPSEPPRCPILQRLPHSLQSWNVCTAAVATVAARNAAEHTQASDISVTSESLPQNISATTVREVVADARKEAAAAADVVLETTFWHRDAIAAIERQAWPEHVKQFVQAILICRGGDKALRIRDEVQRLCKSFESLIEQGEAALSQLSASCKLGEISQRLKSADIRPEEVNTAAAEAAVNQTPTCTRQHVQCPQKEVMKAATWRQRHINLLSGTLPPLRESLHWLHEIEAAAADNKPSSIFIAGDARGPDSAAPALCVPSGFGGCKALDERFQRVLLEHKPKMSRFLATHGWPDHICPKGELSDKEKKQSHKRCRVCSRQFSSVLWVQKQICSVCEENLRYEGRCPFNNLCKESWFCVHAKRCFACDAHSCSECRIFRGDGEVVRDIVDRLHPARISLDFDRTLANTKSGLAPVVGKHVADMELISLLQTHSSSCAVVTRNPHKDDIRKFLTSNGAPEDIPIHTLKRPRSKAEFVIQGLECSQEALFVDDSIAELMDPLVASDNRIHRVLFVRALL